MIVEKVNENEPFENAYKRFKRKCEMEKIFSEMKKYEYYEKPSERRKKILNKKKLRERRARRERSRR